MNIKVKRAYEQPDADDGERILVDRLWPRGLSKKRAQLTQWLKEIAPSTALRVWFGHDPDKWRRFQARYRTELQTNDLVKVLAAKAKAGTVTLIYAARDEEHNEAVVLKEFLEATRRSRFLGGA